MGYLRLRQICLVARNLEAPAQMLCDAFGLAVAHRDPAIAALGLNNILIPMGADPVFIEIVAPIQPGTTAERYVERRGGDGGYMYICDTSDLEAVRERAKAMGMRFIAGAKRDAPMAVENFQIHPRDSGGTMLEFDHHGAGEDMHGEYRWAGADWRKALRREPVTAILGAEIQSDDPAALAERWGKIFDLPVEKSPGGDPELRLDNAFARFPKDRDGRGEGLSAIHIKTTDRAAVLATARKAGAAFDGEDPMICGVRFVVS